MNARFQLAAFLVVAALPAARAEEAEDRSTRTLPVRLESGYYTRGVSGGFGTWRGTQTQLWVRSSKRFIPAFTFDSQSRATATQQNYAAFSYMNWTSSFYTTQGISFAPQRNERAIYFPKFRFDVHLHWKLPPRRSVVLKTGFTSFNFGKPGRGQIFNAGALYYRKKLVLDGNLFVNRSLPGALWSASGSVTAQYGRESAYWLGVSAGGGRELYRFIGTAPTDLNFKSYTVDVFYRRWISRHLGFVVAAEHGQKLTAYRWMGVRSSLFFEF